MTEVLEGVFEHDNSEVVFEDNDGSCAVADSNRTIIEVRRYADDGAGGGPFYVLEVLSDVDEEEEADKIGNALYFDTKEDLRNFAKRLQDEIDALP